jgi:hypothetical protein
MAVVLDYDNTSAAARRLACQILVDFTRECSLYQRELMILGGKVGAVESEKQVSSALSLRRGKKCIPNFFK